MQYDYMRAYLDFYTRRTTADRARGSPSRYRDYPVTPLAGARFARTSCNHLDEAAGKADGAQVDPEEPRPSARRALAAEEPALALEVESRKRHPRATSNLEIRRGPLLPDGRRVPVLDASVRAARTRARSRSSGRTDSEARRLLPGRQERAHVRVCRSEFQNANVLIEVHGGGLTRRKAYYANSLDVHVGRERYGQLKRRPRRESGRPLPHRLRQGVRAHGRTVSVQLLQGRLHRPPRPLRLHVAVGQAGPRRATLLGTRAQRRTGRGHP